MLTKKSNDVLALLMMMLLPLRSQTQKKNWKISSFFGSGGDLSSRAVTRKFFSVTEQSKNFYIDFDVFSVNITPFYTKTRKNLFLQGGSASEAFINVPKHTSLPKATSLAPAT